MYHDFACAVRQSAFSDYAACPLYACLGELFLGDPDDTAPEPLSLRRIGILMNVDLSAELSHWDVIDLAHPLNKQTNHIRVGIGHTHAPTVLVPLSPPEGQPHHVQSNLAVAGVPNFRHRARFDPPSLKSRSACITEAALDGQGLSTAFAPTSRAALREEVVVSNRGTPLGTVFRIPCDSIAIVASHEIRTMLERMNSR